MTGDSIRLDSAAPAPVPAERRVLSLSRPSSRRLPPTIRATAMVFEDPASRALRAELDRLAPSEASILIIGDTGTGKELVARYVHAQSARRDGPFIPVNCGALVDSLVEAELFGYEKGAFTGALKTQIGWFEAANGGTLLLDEIGDLPGPLQVKLLRVLQEREVVRLGSRSAVPIDVRVIAATNVDLREAVSAARFREDLLFRLNVATVDLPPLRARPDDIAPLAAHFLDLYVTRLNRSGLGLSPSALAALRTHAWPGNIRELENVIHNAVLLARGPLIEPADLRLNLMAKPAAPGKPANLEEELRPLLERAIVNSEPELLERVTRLLVRTAFDLSDANQLRTAERLGISRNTLRTHLARLGTVAPRRRRPNQG
jgi:DNA-binding NtrC family response regulator